MISTIFDIFLHSLRRQFVFRDMALRYPWPLGSLLLVHEPNSGWKSLGPRLTHCTYVGVTGEIQSTA